MDSMSFSSIMIGILIIGSHQSHLSGWKMGDSRMMSG
jgi:hypothetical protein